MLARRKAATAAVVMLAGLVSANCASVAPVAAATPGAPSDGPGWTLPSYEASACGDGVTGFATCNAIELLSPSQHWRPGSTWAGQRPSPSEGRGTGDATDPSPPSSGYYPVDLQSAYGLSSAAGSMSPGSTAPTVAVVDAYDDPNAASDLSAYRAAMSGAQDPNTGLVDSSVPPLCSPTVTTGCVTFTKVNQSGGTNYPASNTGWVEEISVDLDMVSAICPACNIVLVEASSNGMPDLAQAVTEAETFHPAVVSNSYGGGESSSETSDNSIYAASATTAITAATGDTGYGTDFPATSPGVTAVGGTTLSYTGTGPSLAWDAQTAWSDTGSGCSAYEAMPEWQDDQGVYDLAADCTGRQVADVSADANPATGVAAYDTFGESGWLVLGGTSVSTQIIGATYALAAGTGSLEPSPEALYPDMGGTATGPTPGLVPVGSGSNGSCGDYLCNASDTLSGGYNGPTGLGTPYGLSAFLAQSPTPTGTVTIEVSGSQTYGSSAPTFSYTDNAPSGIDVGSALTCSTVDRGTSISPSLGAGSYSVDGSSCSGLSLSGTGASDYTISYAGVSDGFVVNPAPLNITASSPSMTYGGEVPTITPNYQSFVNGEGPSSLSTTPTCSTTATSSSPVGTYPSSCSGAVDANYTISYVGGSVAVGQGSQAISFTPPAPGTVGGSATLSATGGASGNPVVFTVDSTSGAGVCNVSGTDGTTVNYTGVGSCVIDADQAGNTDYSAAPVVTQTIPVGSPVTGGGGGSSPPVRDGGGGLTSVGLQPQTVSFTPPASGSAGGSATLSAMGGASGSPVVFTVDPTSGTGVCNVTGTNGTTVNFVAPGDCVIDANQAGNATYANAPQVQRTIVVTAVQALAEQTINFVALAHKTLVQSPLTVRATASSGLTVSFTTTTPSVCNSNGANGATVTLVKTGTCTVWANQAGNATYEVAAPVDQSFTVSKASQTVRFGALTSKTLAQSPLTVHATATSGLAVSFTTTTPSVCTVTTASRGARVTLLKAGTCTVRASQNGNATYQAATPVTHSFQVSKASGTTRSVAPAKTGSGYRATNAGSRALRSGWPSFFAFE